ncbi:hypothetical protein L6452_19101 [Arctium lappa]|uniref:Uncharacterized protein n=1 Tax=Arctium lappa TaxID=4217 RepID=A0ACB9B8I7_ARCLA|nr:hypothetical protein L6452_19101 [Arctium lappa]
MMGIVVEKRNSNDVVKQVDSVGMEVFVGDLNKEITEADAMISGGSHNREDQNDISRNDVEGHLGSVGMGSSKSFSATASKEKLSSVQSLFNSEDSSLHPLEESCDSLSANHAVAENQSNISPARNLVPEINIDATDFCHSSDASYLCSGIVIVLDRFRCCIQL